MIRVKNVHLFGLPAAHDLAWYTSCFRAPAGPRAEDKRLLKGNPDELSSIKRASIYGKLYLSFLYMSGLAIRGAISLAIRAYRDPLARLKGSSYCSLFTIL